LRDYESQNVTRSFPCVVWTTERYLSFKAGFLTTIIIEF